MTQLDLREFILLLNLFMGTQESLMFVLLFMFQPCRGNTLDSHRLIYFAGKQGQDKQHKLVEELFIGYFTQGKYIGDK